MLHLSLEVLYLVLELSLSVEHLLPEAGQLFLPATLNSLELPRVLSHETLTALCL
jgi:hypothetical protein